MMRFTKLAPVLLLSAVTACSWRKTPVTLIPETETGSVALLVGVWTGEYSSPQTGRSGTITFDLASEKDTAFCDVVMIPKFQPIQPVGDGTVKAIVRPQSSAEPLKVRFIKLGDRRVSGILDPYVDPECGCKVTTTFVGTITSGDTIEGTYTSIRTGLDNSGTGGRWRVTRQKPAATLP